MAEVVWLTRDLWRCKSAWRRYREASAMEEVKNTDKGLYRDSGNLALVRWDLSLPARPDNLVLMTIQEAEEHLHHHDNHRCPDRLETLRETHPAFVAFVEAVLRDAAGAFGVRSDVRM